MIQFIILWVMVKCGLACGCCVGDGVRINGRTIPVDEYLGKRKIDDILIDIRNVD